MKDPDPTVELPPVERRPGPLPHPQPLKEDPIFAARRDRDGWGGGYEASNRRVGWIAAVVLVAVGAGVAYYFMNREATPVEPKPAAPVLPVPKAEEEPAIRNPVPQPEAATPLPTLQESDGPALDEIASIIGRQAAKEFLTRENIIRHVVVTIDNLPRKKVAVQQRPVKATTGEFAVVQKGDVITLSPENYVRYAPFVSLVKSADVAQLSKLYFRYYPLFQQSYEDLGYPGKYFNDRVIEVIDHLLETPEVSGPVKLVQPKVFYEFEDPALESRSAGQKLLIRMGSENAAVIKGKLREFRAAIAAQKIQ